MKLRAGLGSLACVLALSAADAGRAWAAEPGPDALPVTVVAMQVGNDDTDEQAAALTRALRNSVRTSVGWSLGEGEYSLEVLRINLKCPEIPDPGCESRIADQIKADRFVWGVVTKKGDEVVGELHLWTRGKGSEKVEVRHSANLTEANDEALKTVANDLLAKLTGGPPKGSVKVTAGDVGGQVFVDGQPVGALTGGVGTFPIPVGSHKIVVKAPGYADAEGTVVVRPNATAEITLTPVAAEVKSDTNVRLIGGIAALGLGVGFGVVGVVSSLQVNGVQNDEGFDAYRQQFPSSSDVCDNAKNGDAPQVAVSGAASAGDVADMCDKAATFEILQAVFYGLAAVSGGVGIFLIATSGSDAEEAKPATGLTVQPRIGLDSGKVQLTYRW